MAESHTRIEHDSMGELEVPADALWGAQTERARRNFRLSSLRQPRAVLRALGLVKAACARANAECGVLDAARAEAIALAADAVAEGAHDAAFPLDVLQTGSGTSTNMNANEVIAHLAAAALGGPVHPNDDVNRSQSSNDVLPTVIHVAVAELIAGAVLPAFAHLAAAIDARAAECAGIVKTGRTHLMDAVPMTLGQELGGWAALVRDAAARLESSLVRVRRLAIGGTAVGTGLNAPPEFGLRACRALALRTGQPFEPAPDYFAAQSSQDTAVEVSGQARAAAVTLAKIANDLRWMNSGPLSGLGEIGLPALQPGSSIMPGKVNPVIPEAVLMACAQVIGNDASIAVAGQAGNFQLNTMLPLIAHNLAQSLGLLDTAARALADQAIAGFVVNGARLERDLAANPMLATALNPVIGYERAAAIARTAAETGESVLAVAVRLSGLPASELAAVLDPAKLAHPGRSGN